MADPFDTPAATPAGTKDDAEFDRYGRYVIPHPISGKKTSWTRATTYAKSISDTYSLNQWMLRMAVKGVATRPDLYALAAATPVDDKDKLNRIAEDAKEAAAAKAGANLGTALHSFTEQVDRGQTPNVPEPWAADVDAYRRMLTDHGIRILPQYLERKVVVPDITIAGTFDRIVDWHGLKIGDLKTGKDLDYGWLEISIQLAIYSRATHMWNQATRTFEPMPAVDQDVALVFHLPVGKATATLYQVDIAAGWQAAQLCGQVRDWRKRRDLATPLKVGAPITPAATTSAAVDIPEGRKTGGSGSAGLHALITSAASIDELTRVWQDADRVGAWTTAHTDAAKKRRAALEAATTS